MKKLFFLLMLTAITANSYGITFHSDTTCPYKYANVSYTDSVRHLYNLPLKLVINPIDYRDTIRGCDAIWTLYYADKTIYASASTQFRGATYNTWSDDASLYNIIAADWAIGRVYITFLP